MPQTGESRIASAKRAVTAPVRALARRRHTVALLIALCCVLFVLSAWRMEYSEEPFFRFFRLAEMSSLNARFLARGPMKPSDDIAIVVLDEDTIRNVGAYPLPRGVYAKLLDRLTDAGAKVVVFDILFSEPQNKAVLDRLDGLIAAAERAPEAQRADGEKRLLADLKKGRQAADEDGKLAAAMERALGKETWVICGMVFLRKAEAAEEGVGRALSEEEERFLHNFTYTQQEPKNRDGRKELLEQYPPIEAVSVQPVIMPIAEKCAGLAYVDFTPDWDGVLRYETLVTRYKGNFYMPVPVMATWFFLNPDPQQIWVKFTQGVQIAGIDVPADVRTRMLINYCGGSAVFPKYSLYDVAEGKIDPATFKGKMVFVGATAKGTGDFVVTPFSARLPGVEKHAHVASNILQKKFIRRTIGTLFVDIAAVLVFGVALGLLLPVLSPVAGLLLTLGTGGGWIVFAQCSFSRWGAWHNIVYPFLTVFLSFALITLYRFAVEEKRRREVKRVFERYMDPAVVSEMLQDADDIKLGGDSMRITVFFSDVAGFTRISEGLQSGQLIDLLNRYFTPLTDIILKHGGFMNKYQGDAIVAAFGVPRERPDHAVRACSAAIDCQKRLRELNREFVAAGLPPLPTRIGLSSGLATAGNIGSARRLEYTVIGDSINLGQRLEAANKEFKTSTIIGEETFKMAKEKVAVRDIGLLSVVGRDKPVHAYELLDYAGALPDGVQQLVALFETGLAHFQARRWDEAARALQEALRLAPEDGPSKKYLDLCLRFKAAPPPPDWDGAVVMAGK